MIVYETIDGEVKLYRSRGVHYFSPITDRFYRGPWWTPPRGIVATIYHNNPELVVLKRKINEVLKHTFLSDSAKSVLRDSAMDFYVALRGKRIQRNERRKVALYLACDKHLCSIPNKLECPNIKTRRKGRKILNIPPVILPSQRLAATVKILGLPDEVLHVAKQWTTNELRFPIQKPSVAAAALVHIADLKINKEDALSPHQIAVTLGISTQYLCEAAKRLLDGGFITYVPIEREQ